MKLVSAAVGPFKSINSKQEVIIDRKVTAFVGMNEAGKTVFLQALTKAADALGIAKFNPVDDYPRKDLSSYLKRHKVQAEEAVTLKYKLSDSEVAAINAQFKTKIGKGFEVSVSSLYSNTRTVSINIDESPVVHEIANRLSSDAKTKLADVKTFRAIPDALAEVSLTETDKPVLAEVSARIAKTEWTMVVQSEVWVWLNAWLPKFLYFSDYDLLPSKINLTDLASRVAQAQKDPKHLQAAHRAVLALLRMADISVEDFTKYWRIRTLKSQN